MNFEESFGFRTSGFGFRISPQPPVDKIVVLGVGEGL
jgi:hypothetical protein